MDTELGFICEKIMENCKIWFKGFARYRRMNQ